MVASPRIRWAVKMLRCKQLETTKGSHRISFRRWYLRPVAHCPYGALQPSPLTTRALLVWFCFTASASDPEASMALTHPTNVRTSREKPQPSPRSRPPTQFHEILSKTYTSDLQQK